MVSCASDVAGAALADFPSPRKKNLAYYSTQEEDLESTPETGRLGFFGCRDSATVFMPLRLS